MIRAAIYLRVSTEDQHVENQRPECEELVSKRGWTVHPAHLVEETGSGAKARAGWERVLELARARKIERVVAWSLDRVGRTLWGVADAFRELDKIGCPIVTVREPWLEVESLAGLDPMLVEYMRVQMVHQFAFIAAWERRRLIERTMLGLAAARKRGSVGGRPRAFAGPALEAALTAREGGKSWGEIRKMLRESYGKTLPKGTIARAVKRLQAEAA